MKLAEILAEIMEEWPSTTKYYAQDCNGTVYPWIIKPCLDGGFWDRGSLTGTDIDPNPEARSYRPYLASDWDEALVTKEDWMRERIRLGWGGYESEYLLDLARERIEELEQERDDLARDLESERHHRRAVEYSEQALTAHLERLQRAFKATTVTGWSVPTEESLVEVFADSPKTSLARLKTEWDKAELQPVWETLIKVADLLSIDAEEARSLPGKPSDVYAAYLARMKAKWQAEILNEFTHGSYIMPASLNLSMCRRAKELRQQAEVVSDEERHKEMEMANIGEITVKVSYEDIQPAVVDALGVTVEDLGFWAALLQKEGYEGEALRIRDRYVKSLKEYQERWEED